MAESIPNPEQEKQAELLRQQQEQWELQKKELNEKFEDYWQKRQQKILEGIKERANGLHFRPEGENPEPILDVAGDTQARKAAKIEADRQRFEWLKAEQKKFFEAQKAERDRQAALEQERADKGPEVGADAPQNLPPRSHRPDRSLGQSRYEVLRQAEREAVAKEPAQHDKDMDERVKRNRALLREELAKDHERER